jgi:hypothetical protein
MIKIRSDQVEAHINAGVWACDNKVVLEALRTVQAAQRLSHMLSYDPDPDLTDARFAAGMLGAKIVEQPPRQKKSGKVIY